MILRYRGKITGGRPDGHRRRRRLAISIEVARVMSLLVLLYLALVCAIGVGLWLANDFNYNLSDNVAQIPVLRQLAIQSDLIADYGAGVLPIGLALALVSIVAIHFIANILVDDVVNR